MLYRRQRVFQFLHHAHPVVVLSSVGHAITRNQNFGLNLFETIQYRQGPHVGRADAPNTAQADGGQKGNHCLGNVWQVGGNPVPRLKALRL